MIQRIELWDFESHEHTVVEDISPAVSLFCGESNSGKTSVIRALKLAAYNDFDPESVRVGSTKCVVQVDTDKGRVKVTRGPKHNIWETTRNGQPTQYFEKVGVNVVPEAAAIMGLNIITLGDVQVPVNIMDQLESHFMLSGVGDKDATGSMRAQIVDEISGLSGIEGIIKSVSLDHHRFGREIKETEDKMEETRNQLHPENEIKAEEAVLTGAEKELSDHGTMVALSEDGDGLRSKWDDVSLSFKGLQKRVDEIPDTDKALLEISKAADKTGRETLAVSLHRDGTGLHEKIGRINDRISEMPDEVSAADFVCLSDRSMTRLSPALDVYRRGSEAYRKKEEIEKIISGMPNDAEASLFASKSGEALSRLVAALDILRKWQEFRANLEDNVSREKEISEALKSESEISVARDALTLRSSVIPMLNSVMRIQSREDELVIKLADYDKAVLDAEMERDQILASIKTCPLTLRPVSKECLEGAANA